ANIFSAGKPVNIRLTGPNMSILQEAATELKSQLRLIDGVEDISDSFRLGKQEINLKLNSQGQALGLRQNDLARQVRQAFFGEEAQRIQRNRDDVKVMVRYPKESRQSVRDLYELRIRTSDGEEIPVKQVTDIEAGVGYASISRVDGRRSVNITADVDPQKAQASQIIERLRSVELPNLLSKHPGIQYGFDGDRQEQEVALSSMLRSYLIAMVIIYALLAIPFGSYLQPFIVMGAIPFGLIGAVAGHIIMGMDLTILSMFGVVALTGVVVNDSLIMVDYVNRNRNKYGSLMEAVRMSGVARFRAILLTSLTTFAGLAPLIFFEKSVQAQFLIPMAISLAFGVMFATAVTLVLVPAGYIILEDVKAYWHWLYGSQKASQPADRARQGVQIRNI
ncbi:MAG: efflux RND transporter permease subunit, partial [Verrucomicrobiota bacterium]|nr:efflux RND transporter permease subunit [Verrucomicrobiota bacterium]